MLEQLQYGLRSFFEKEDGAYEKAISWTCQEKFRPDCRKNDLVLVFPHIKSRIILASYVSSMISLVSGWIGLEAEEYSVTGSSGYVALSPGQNGKIIIIENCIDGPNKSMLLLRLLRRSL